MARLQSQLPRNTAGVLGREVLSMTNGKLRIHAHEATRAAHHLYRRGTCCSVHYCSEAFPWQGHFLYFSHLHAQCGMLGEVSIDGRRCICLEIKHDKTLPCKGPSIIAVVRKCDSAEVACHEDVAMCGTATRKMEPTVHSGSPQISKRRGRRT